VRRITDVKQSAAGYAKLPAVAGGTQLEQQGFARGLFGVESRVAIGIGGYGRAGGRAAGAFEAAGVDLVLLQFSPQAEEMERFGQAVNRSRGFGTGDAAT